jgi:hypothetical protein
MQRPYDYVKGITFMINADLKPFFNKIPMNIEVTLLYGVFVCACIVELCCCSSNPPVHYPP